jgi:Ankyrin repeats (3 copies)
MFGHAAVVELLLAQDGVDPDSEDDDSKALLVLAEMYGHDAVIKPLLDTGRVAPEFKDAKYSRTPLSWVVERGNAAAVEKLLVTDGVDPGSKGNDGRTSLLLAAAEAHTETIQSLSMIN